MNKMYTNYYVIDDHLVEIDQNEKINYEYYQVSIRKGKELYLRKLLTYLHFHDYIICDQYDHVLYQQLEQKSFFENTKQIDPYLDCPVITCLEIDGHLKIFVYNKGVCS